MPARSTRARSATGASPCASTRSAPDRARLRRPRRAPGCSRPLSTRRPGALPPRDYLAIRVPLATPCARRRAPAAARRPDPAAHAPALVRALLQPGQLLLLLRRRRRAARDRRRGDQHAVGRAPRLRARAHRRAACCAALDKELHVSPFMGMDHAYEVRATAPGETLSVHIESRARRRARVRRHAEPAPPAAPRAPGAPRLAPAAPAHAGADLRPRRRAEAQGRARTTLTPRRRPRDDRTCRPQARLALLERIESGQLTLVEGGARRVFGSGSPQATVVVRDPRRVAGAAARRQRAGRDLRRRAVGLARRDRRDRGRRPQPARASTGSGARLTPVREPWQRGRALLARNTPLRARDDIAAHYDLGNDLFELMLDETMMYSSAIFERRDDDAGGGVAGQARPHLRQARPRPVRPRAGDRDRLGRLRAARRRRRAAAA